MYPPRSSSNRHFSARTPSISITLTRTFISPRSFFVLSLVFATLSCDSRVQEAGLNEKRLLNQLRLGEVELDPDEAELGPDKPGEYGTGSIVTRRSSAKVIETKGERTLLLLLEHPESVLSPMSTEPTLFTTPAREIRIRSRHIRVLDNHVRAVSL